MTADEGGYVKVSLEHTAVQVFHSTDDAALEKSTVGSQMIHSTDDAASNLPSVPTRLKDLT